MTQPLIRVIQKMGLPAFPVMDYPDMPGNDILDKSCDGIRDTPEKDNAPNVGNLTIRHE